MAASTVRVLGMKAMGPVRLAGLRSAIASGRLRGHWFVTADKNALTMSLRPKDEPVVPHVPSQKPFRRLASHMTITRRGVVVLVNCEMQACLETLALARAHAGEMEPDASATIPSLGQELGGGQGVLSKLISRLGLASSSAPPRPPMPTTAMPFEGPAAARAEPGLRRVSDYLTVRVTRSLDRWCTLERGTLAVKRLDLDSVRVIAGAMERSIELQVQEGAADRLHAEAAWLNERVRENRLGAVARQHLYRLLAGNSATANAVVGTGVQSLRHPGSPAWQDERYESLLSALSEELELERRAADVGSRLERANELIKFCLHEKSEGAIERLEAMIVLILALELGISLVELWHGRGRRFVRRLWQRLSGADRG